MSNTEKDEPTNEQALALLSLRMFILAALIFIVALGFIGFSYIKNKQQFSGVIDMAIAANTPELCNSIHDDTFAIRCFLSFTRKGFTGCSEQEKALHCFTALGIVTGDEETCSLPLLRQHLTFKNECMSEMLVERYER